MGTFDSLGLTAPAASTSVASWTVVVAVGGSIVIALLGWWVAARNAARGQKGSIPSQGWRNGWMAFVVVASALAAIIAPVIAVMWVLVALNFAFGRHENVPLSTYPMFSEPGAKAWALRFEDANGELVPIALLGIHPVKARKRFSRALEAAKAEGITGRAARQRAGEVLAALVEQHRPPIGPWSEKRIKIIMIDYEFESGAIVTRHTQLVETAP